MMYNMDRLYESVSDKGHVCVGLDTSPGYIPPLSRSLAASDAEAVLAFNYAIIDTTADKAACFKVQIAYYEALGRAGFDVYAKTLALIHEKKSLVIADIKRGDIADTALQYAKAHFEGDFEADFVTLSPYMGMDSIEPWLAYAKDKGKGAFVLMRTSNKGMRDFQYLELRDTTRLYHAVGDKLSILADQYRGNYGYGAFGAVVGANPKTGTEREEVTALREQYGNLFFLIPGYGAQGGAAEDAALLLREGNGGVVNASRSILNAWTVKAANNGQEANNEFAAEAAGEAVVVMRDAIWKAAGI
ncbi:MAG: orotidine-5'-phosphate decarboxylase [Treponema sp.]|nr:orotidine-5'-phosphate decarboxylase [Treponema sp.]